MRMQSFHLSVQGASHIKKNKECQDASDSYRDENCAIAIVCDGHGGDDYVRSASGSSFACAAAKSCILNFLENVNREDLKRHYKQLIHNLKASIISAWNEAVYEHYNANSFTEAEIAVLSDRAKRKYLQEKRIESAYGTTVIAVACTKDFWFGLHIGDGKCVAVNPEGKFLQPIPWDDKCFLNATTSICDSDALNRFRSFYSEKLPIAVFVGSDGIDDCFTSEQQLNNLYKTVLYSFTASEFDDAVDDLRDYLPRLSAKGSGDDVSVAAILDMDMIGEIEAVKAFDKEKEKARVEENARIAAQKLEEERIRVEAERAEQRRQQQKQAAQQQKDTQGQKKPKLLRTCVACGGKLLPNMKYCCNCGAKVVADDVKSATDEPLNNLGDVKADPEPAVKTDVAVVTATPASETVHVNTEQLDTQAAEVNEPVAIAQNVPVEESSEVVPEETIEAPEVTVEESSESAPEKEAHEGQASAVETPAEDPLEAVEDVVCDVSEILDAVQEDLTDFVSEAEETVEADISLQTDI